MDQQFKINYCKLSKLHLVSEGSILNNCDGSVSHRGRIAEQE